MKKIKYFIFLFITVFYFTACADNPSYVKKSKAVKVKGSSQNNEQRVALVIGNNAYQGVLSKLNNPINDAQAIKEILENRGFQVIYAEDTTKRSIVNNLDKFYTALKKGGVGMFYFSGHGIEVDGQNYLIPVDAKIEAKSDTEFEAIALNKITKRMQNIGNRLNIVVLDACRNDPFSRGLNTGGLAKVEPIGMFVSFSTGAGSVSSDGRVGGHGLFTESLIKYMSQELDLRDVFQQTRKEVYVNSNQQQFPAIYDQTINGGFYFTYPSSSSHTTNIVVNEPTVIYVPQQEPEHKKNKVQERDSIRPTQISPSYPINNIAPKRTHVEEDSRDRYFYPSENYNYRPAVGYH